MSAIITPDNLTKPAVTQVYTAKRGKINWYTAFVMAVFHVGAIAALFMFSWKALLITAILWYFSLSCGIGMGYHRLLTHRGYKVPKWLEYFLTTCATLMWGSRRFVTKDDSTNNWWVAMVTFGEGWHNNHHAHPVSARHGLTWYEIDLNYIGICVLKLVGLAKDVKVVDMPKKLREQEEKLAAKPELVSA